jgi:hypothetical protein
MVSSHIPDTETEADRSFVIGYFSSAHPCGGSLAAARYARTLSFLHAAHKVAVVDDAITWLISMSSVGLEPATY